VDVERHHNIVIQIDSPNAIIYKPVAGICIFDNGGATLGSRDRGAPPPKILRPRPKELSIIDTDSSRS